MVVEEVIVHRNNNVDITLAKPIESEPTTEDSVSVQTLANVQTLEPSFDGLNRHENLRFGRLIWVQFKRVRVATVVPHNSLPERVGPLGTREARDRGSTPRPARHSQASEPGRTSDPCHKLPKVGKRTNFRTFIRRTQ